MNETEIPVNTIDPLLRDLLILMQCAYIARANGADGIEEFIAPFLEELKAIPVTEIDAMDYYNIFHSGGILACGGLN